MPTIRQALDKVSELRSRTAMLEGLVLYLQAHYLDNDTGEAEMTFIREDLGIVPQKHISDLRAWLEDQLVQVRAEIEEWEGMQLSSPTTSVPIKKRKAVREQNTTD